MKDFDTLTDALNDLRSRGFINDFNIECDCVKCKNLELKLKPEEFEITEYYRFEGNSNPDDEEVIYGITSRSGIKGVIIDAYGTYSDELTNEMLEKLKINR